MDYRNLNNSSFEFMMKNALIERYKDEVQSLRKEDEEGLDFAGALKKELDRKNSGENNNSGGTGGIW